MPAPVPDRRQAFPVPLHPTEDVRVVPPALPRPLTSFVGRRDELDTLCAMLDRSDIRLVTLTGPGGAGKTRLAIRAAETFAARDLFVAFVPLAAISDPALVVPTIAASLGVRESEHRVVRRLTDHLSGQPALLVLDNVEQVIEAAPDVVELLVACPDLTVLATSRVVLRVSGEHDLPLPPLDLPVDHLSRTSTEIAGSAAVALFVQRAQAANPAFLLTDANAPDVARICARLDGLPLAIELAAAHSRTLSPTELLARLDDRLGWLVGGPRDQPRRLRTMREAIAWSYDRLSIDLQSLFRQLSVFVDRFTLESAGAVTSGLTAGARDRSTDLLAIEELVDASLIVRGPRQDGESRFHLLETIRDFGLEQLAESGDDVALRRRHADYVLALLEQAEPRLISAGASTWVERLAVEWPNIRAAIRWTIDQGEGHRILRLAGTLHSIAYARGEPTESLTWLLAALAQAESSDPGLVVDATFAAAALAQVQGDFDRSTALSNAGIALARQHGYAFGEARMLLGLGITAEWQ
ncbi:MAG: AAA family ATPase, partial [Thermomicrobiales bacterium]|nr:AAA family ATPase [Thermomicrobiales bacterium]